MDDHCHGWGGGPHRKGRTRDPMMNVQGNSDLPIVPAKSPNNAASAAAEAMEGRGGAKGNAHQSGTRQTQSWESVSPALERIRDAARRDKRVRFTALLHHVSVDLLRFSALQLKKAASPGVDGVTPARLERELSRATTILRSMSTSARLLARQLREVQRLPITRRFMREQR